MSHMVIFQTPEGNPGYNQFETVAEAVAFVEKLRNEQLVENARIFALEELKFDFRPYYRVELTALERAAGQTNGSHAGAGGSRARSDRSGDRSGARRRERTGRGSPVRGGRRRRRAQARRPVRPLRRHR